MNQFSILVIDDEPDNFDVIETLLSHQDYQLHYAANGYEGIASLTLFQPDVILLDVMMPGMDGIETCQRIKAMPKWESVPIIMVTSLTTKTDLAQCLTAGANDFISKPVNRLELTARVRSMLRIHQQYQQLATFNTRLEETVQQRTAQLHTMIFQDALTQLPSRAFLLQQLDQILQQADPSFAVVYLDCDQFKLVNGSFGYAIGNQLLLAIADRLREHLQPHDILARMGEDEFCFLFSHVVDKEGLKATVEAIMRSFDAPFVVAQCEIFITACLGIALGNRTYHQSEEPLQDADAAMYRAKLFGKGCYQFFDYQISSAMRNRLTLENDLQRALKHHEFITYYQPIVNLETQALYGFEALVRWQHPTRGMVSPGEFIPCLEETGLIVPVGMEVLRQACQQLRTWQHQGWPELMMSVNLSVRQFSCPTLLADIDRVLQETSINPAYLKLEITESAIMENAQMAIELTEQLRSRQIEISIDDFGTGYSSLGYLHRFSVDTLKIDRSFVNQIQSGNRDYQVVNAIVALSNQLKLAVVAEGIETIEQLKGLLELGCKLGQGYLFSKPLAAEAIEDRYLKLQQSSITCQMNGRD